MGPKLCSSTIAKRKATSTNNRKMKMQKLEKVCSFWDLPSLLRLPLLKKLEAVSLTRLRRSNKALNRLIEENGLRARSDQQLVIRVDFDLKKSPLSFFTTRDEIVDLQRHIFLSWEMEEGNYTKIRDPLKELVGIHFKAILVEICCFHVSDAPKFWRLFKTRAMPTLEVLKPHCDALVFTCITNFEDIAPVLEHVTYTSLIFEDCEIDATKMNLSVTNGNIIDVRYLKPNDIAAAFSTFSQFKHGLFSIMDDDVSVVPHIIKAVHELPLGKLEKLTVTIHSEKHVHEDEDGNVENGQEQDDDDEEDGESFDDENDCEDGEDDGKADRPLNDDDDLEGDDLLNDDDICDPHNISRFSYMTTIRAKTSSGNAVHTKFYKMPIVGGGRAIIAKIATSTCGNDIATDFVFYLFPNYSKKKLFEAFFDQFFGEWDLNDGLRSPQYHAFLETSSEQEALEKACKKRKQLETWLEENGTLISKY